MTFTSFGLRPEILKAIGELGFENPTPIQEKVIPHILESGQDIVGLAQTGTGKTAAFGLPLTEKLADSKSPVPGALILCPTRELCLQITRDMASFSTYLKSPKVTAVYGGAGMREQIRDLKKGTDIIVATPGRILDLINRGAADISAIEYLILDEGDIMLNMGFKDELDAILSAAPKERQTLLLTATMPAEVSRIAKEYMISPLEITAGEKNTATATVEHTYFMVHAREKYMALKRLVDVNPEIYGIIFCRTKVSTGEIADKMIRDGYNAEPLHGDLSQAQREMVMKKFREKRVQLLVATDVAARGLDVQNLTHVIHYDLPDETDAYNHRSGRTGRAGKAGASYAIVNLREKHKILQIQKSIGRKIEEGKLPGGEEICQNQLLALIDRVTTAEVDEATIAPFMSVVQEKFAGLEREEIIKKFVSLEFNRFLQFYKDLPDPVLLKGRDKQSSNSAQSRPGRKGRDAGFPTAEPGFVMVSINLGRREGVLPPQLIGLVNQASRNRHIDIGRIDIGVGASLLQIESAHAKEVCQGLNKISYQGTGIKAQIETTLDPGFDYRGGSGGRSRGGSGRPGGKPGGYKGKPKSGGKGGSKSGGKKPKSIRKKRG